MPTIGSGHGKDEGRVPPPGRAGGPLRAARHLGGLALLAFGLPFLLLIAGFFVFVLRVPTDEVTLDRNADGIVVLTGGASRIADAIELLASGRGTRLLITGVHRTTSQREIQRLLPAHGRIFACCVDLDRSALNTVGNATEARRWVKDRGFRSLIVVTSNYHMPRAMAELAHQLPDITLIAYPVVTERQRHAAWWSSEAAARLMISEYLKFMLAQMRMRLELDGDADAAADKADKRQRHGAVFSGASVA